jgi:glutamate decarboxylase
VPFVAAADEDAKTKHTGHGLRVEGGGPRTTLVEHHPPKKLESIVGDELKINEVENGKEGLMAMVDTILKYSVNTWDQGFLDKLYGSPNAVCDSLTTRCCSHLEQYNSIPILTFCRSAS